MGIDPSLSSTGWAYRDDAGEVITGTIETEKLRGPWRLHYAAAQLEKILIAQRPTLVMYEDYAMGAKGNTYHIGELGGVYKRMLWFMGIDYIEVGNTMLKRLMTGRGSAGGKRGKKTVAQKKQPMVDALREEFGLTVPQFDEADAAGLMLLGEIRCGVNHGTQKQLISERLAALKGLTVTRGKLQSIAISSKVA